MDEPTTRNDADPLQAYWGMPRRIRLRVEKKGDSYLIWEYVQQNGGVNYDGSWEHPLSPYELRKDGTLGAEHGQPHRLAYNHWLGLVTNKHSTRPALVVRALPARASRRWLRDRLVQPMLWASGYDTVPGKPKTRLWIESRQIPIVLADPNVDDAAREALEATVEQLAMGANALAKALENHLREALFGRPELERGCLRGTKIPKTRASASGGAIEQAVRRFWTDTERLFLDALNESRDACAEATGDLDATLRKVRRGWLETVRKHLLVIFDEASDLASDPATRVVARQRLSLTATPTAQASRDVCKALGLPLPQKPSRKKTPSTSSAS